MLDWTRYFACGLLLSLGGLPSPVNQSCVCVCVCVCVYMCVCFGWYGEGVLQYETGVRWSARMWWSVYFWLGEVRVRVHRQVLCADRLTHNNKKRIRIVRVCVCVTEGSCTCVCV